MKLEGRGRISSTWQTLLSLIGFAVVGTFAWAAIRNEQNNQAAAILRVQSRQDVIDARLNEQHDLLLRLGMNVDYLATGRKGIQPPPTVP